MSGALLSWLIIGAGLIVAELVTGTFYLLVFGLAAWVGAAVAYFDQSIGLQLAASGVAVLIGLAVLVPYDIRRRARAATANVDMEVGNEVRVESSSGGGRLRVSYRGAQWDATVDKGHAQNVNVGDTCIITAVHGNTLVVRLHR